MKGFVDGGGLALVEVALRSAANSAARNVTVWIDTGFTGDVVLPQRLVDEMQLELSGRKRDSRRRIEVSMRTYSCFIDWFDELRQLEIVANDGEYPLLGVGLLYDRELPIDYCSASITLE